MKVGSLRESRRIRAHARGAVAALVSAYLSRPGIFLRRVLYIKIAVPNAVAFSKETNQKLNLGASVFALTFSVRFNVDSNGLAVEELNIIRPYGCYADDRRANKE